MRRQLITILLLVLILPAQSQQVPSFSITDESFVLNGRPFTIRCGEMHFARIPREYWRHRLQMAHAMGLNTVCAYLFWNFHERAPGRFNWQGMADVAAFCKTAQEEGLYVILRPGPYACAEWDFGGLPWWLLKKKDIKMRTQDPYWLDRCRSYLKEVGRVLGPWQVNKGGNILMVQVENEYGSYGSDKEYIGKLRDYLSEAGFTVPFFTCDGPVQLKNDTRSDIFAAVNFGSDPEGGFKALREIRPAGPLICSEYYPGWFDSWGRKHHTGSDDKVIKDISYMLSHKASFSIYMVHGGTTFGLWAGANCPPYAPETSSYDYDAPIGENGLPTTKYYHLRNLLAQSLLPGERLPDVPKALPVQTIKPFFCTEVAPVMAQLSSPVRSDTTLSFEDLNIEHGAVLYEATLPAGNALNLEVTAVHDYALVYLDDQYIGTLDRIKNEHRIRVPARTAAGRLRLFTEAMGRVNYGDSLHDRKGLIGAVYTEESGMKSVLTGWRHYAFALGDKNPLLSYQKINGSNKVKQPALYKAFFNTGNNADFFLDVRSFNKGVVWINGHCLGRYWNIGPTQTMYVPGVWLNKGRNELVVMDIYQPGSLALQGLESPILDSLTTGGK
jgi:beta-galactosidase